MGTDTLISEIATALVGNLASLLKEQGKLAEAEPLYREALEGRREVLGPRHPPWTLSSGAVSATSWSRC